MNRHYVWTQPGLCALFWLVASGVGHAQPLVQSASGNWSHRASVTISGSGFGTKSTAAPLVWDDSSSTSIAQKWDGGWPSAAADQTHNIAYRTPIRGITPPHQRVGRYLAGAHANEASNGGYNVMVWKHRNVSYPSVTYLSWYYRMDDNWVFGGDNNTKNYAWSEGPQPFEGHYFYAEYNPRPTSRTSGCAWALYDSGGIGLSPSMTWGEACTNPMSGRWAKIEIEARWSRNTDGFFRVYDNGRLVINYQGRTDGIATTQRTEAVGGYARIRNINNWRYLTDIYLDTSLQRVVLGNAPTWAASTRREVQVPTSWSNTSIVVSANLGAFADNENAYLYVFDANGNVNSQGYPVTLGAGGPAAPSNLRIIR